MLNIDIKWLTTIVLLNSDRLLEARLNNQSVGTPNLQNGELKQSIQLAFLDYQSYLNSPLRKEDIEFALKEWLNKAGEIDSNLILTKIHRYFLSWSGDCFEVKPQYLEEWLSLIAMQDPAWIIGAGYADLLQHQVLGIEQVLVALAHQCPSALPKRFDGKAIADNHVHLNGHGHNSLSLLDFSLYLTKKPITERNKWPYRPECSLFNSEKLDLTLLPLMVNQIFSSLAKGLWSEGVSDFPDWNKLTLSQLNTDILVTLETQNSKTKAQQLLVSSHLADLPEIARWLLIPIALLLEKNNSNKDLSNKIDSFINASNLLRNYMIMSGVGLGTFVDYFSFKFRKPSSKGLNYKAHSLTHDFSAKTYREFRGAPGLVVDEKWKKSRGESTFRLKPTELTKFANELVSKQLDTRSHFVIHFNRSFSKTAPKGNNYQIAFRSQLLTHVRKLQLFFSSVSHADTPLSTDLSAAETISADLRALVRGFDVAGNENELPIEIFAPTLRVLRAAKHEYQSQFEIRLRQPFLTIHAGEDYSHLLSGLRAIDEAVLFCDFKSGDRLGHALALGVDVYYWAKRQQRVYLTAGQHLDNLVWCYHQGLELIQQIPELHAALCIIENKIHRWSGYIYDDINVTPSDLFQAWKLRRNCPLMSTLPSQAVGTEWELWVPDIAYIEKNQTNTAVKIWQHYLNKDLMTGAVQSSRYDDVVTIDCRTIGVQAEGELELSDTLSNGELQLIHAIQDLLIERYSKRQIILEACPTSNIFIGRFKQYVEHPIFRWNPPVSNWLQSGNKFNTFGIRKGPISVCVNTDDAGIMPTTIENEHRILKQTAISDLEVSCFDADIWIDRVRQIGVDIFKSNHLNWITRS